MSEPLIAINRLSAELKEWVEKQEKSGSLYARRIEGFEKELEKDSRESTLEAALAAESVSKLESAAGANMLLDGEQRGWLRISNAVDYYYWFLRAHKAHLESIGRAYVSFHYSIPWFMHTFCLAVALGKHDIAHWLAEELQRFYEHGLVERGTDDVPYREFIRVFSACYLQNQWPTEKELGAELGVYRELFCEGGGAALIAACDYHLDKALPGDEPDMSGSDRAFTWLPYTLLPAEILAFLKFREGLGMSRIEVSHPLLETPLAKLPDGLLAQEDKSLQKLTEYADKYFKSTKKGGFLGFLKR